MKSEQKYCNSLTTYSRWKTREVNIGGIPLGGQNPIRVQSMTTVPTMDTKSSIEQCIRMADAGCDYIRITAPNKKEAQNLLEIKKGLRAQGYHTPLIADIHYTPNAAEVAAQIVEKVRVNPGNYVDKKKFESLIYTDQTYAEELERIRERLLPLIRICKENGTAMRIGTNHGSLSDRIMSRYGDTAHGMVESALEFVRICADEGYHELVLSMKSSNPQVMVHAYRLLVNQMIAEGFNYPLHLGVTEAGEGEDGRIKSAVGIGTLLEDGLGDTIRVSLTEEPENEVPVAKALVNRYSDRKTDDSIPEITHYPIDPYVYHQRETTKVLNIGGKHVPRIIADFSLKKEIKPSSLFALGYQYSVPLDKWNITDQACDYIFLGENEIDFEIPGTLGLIQAHSTWLNNKQKERHYPFILVSDYIKGIELSDQLNFVYCCLSDLEDALFDKLKTDKSTVLVIDTYNPLGMAEQRRFFVELINFGIKTPIIISREYENLSTEDLQLWSSTDMGGLLLDGLGDGIFMTTENCGSDQFLNQTAFGILQATRTRISKTEYISCPSCGRTLFNLQETTAKIRAKTDHLKGVKIGIMGCIVNGPGEMADADYGYVGTGPGVITLYKEKEVVKRNVPEKEAVEELINLIKEYGDWVEKPLVNSH